MEIEKQNRKFRLFHHKNRFLQVKIVLEKIDLSDEKVEIFDFLISKFSKSFFFFDSDVFMLSCFSIYLEYDMRFSVYLAYFSVYLEYETELVDCN